MIVFRSTVKVNRGYGNEAITQLKAWMSSPEAKHVPYRIYRNYIGDNDLIVLEGVFDSMAEWEKIYNMTEAEADFSHWYKATRHVKLTFWTIEEQR